MTYTKQFPRYCRKWLTNKLQIVLSRISIWFWLITKTNTKFRHCIPTFCKDHHISIFLIITHHKLKKLITNTKLKMHGRWLRYTKAIIMTWQIKTKTQLFSLMDYQNQDLMVMKLSYVLNGWNYSLTSERFNGP